MKQKIHQENIWKSITKKAINKVEEQAIKEIIKVLHREKKDVKKGDYGKVAVIGGSEEYSGGIILCAEAVYNHNIDLVKLVCIQETKGPAITRSPWLIASSFPTQYFQESLAEEVIRQVEKYNTLIVGPGMGTRNTTTKFIYQVIEKSKAKRIVLDADALHLFSIYPEQKIKKITKQKDIIITPHRGEFKKYFKLEPNIKNAQEISKKYNITILLKAPEDIIVKDKNKVINKHGTSYLAKAGTGDTLVGIVGAFYEHIKEPFKAAYYGVLWYSILAEIWGERNKYNTHILNPEFYKQIE